MDKNTKKEIRDKMRDTNFIAKKIDDFYESKIKERAKYIKIYLEDEVKSRRSDKIYSAIMISVVFPFILILIPNWFPNNNLKFLMYGLYVYTLTRIGIGCYLVFTLEVKPSDSNYLKRWILRSLDLRFRGLKYMNVLEIKDFIIYDFVISLFIMLFVTVSPLLISMITFICFLIIEFCLFRNILKPKTILFKDFLFVRGQKGKKSRWIDWKKIRDVQVKNESVKYFENEWLCPMTPKYRIEYYLTFRWDHNVEIFRYGNRHEKSFEIYKDFLKYMSSFREIDLEELEARKNESRNFDPKYCSFCGNAKKKEVEFCHLCGTKFESILI